MARGGSRPPTAGVFVLKLPDDDVLGDLFHQAVVNRVKGEHFSIGLRNYSELLLAELQGQIYAAAHRREYRVKQAERAAGNHSP
jgi:hypothetical protein